MKNPLRQSAQSAAPLPPSPRRLSDDLDHVFTSTAEHPTTLDDIIRRLEGRELGVLLLIIGLPFVIPLPSPGLSTPFGLALAAIGLRYISSAPLHLPPRIAQHAFQPVTLQRFRTAARAVTSRLDWLVHPRLPHVLGERGRLITGLAIVSASLALAVPGPGSNVAPALALVAIAVGIIGRDGLILLVGIILSVLSWLYVALISWLVIRFWQWLHPVLFAPN